MLLSIKNFTQVFGKKQIVSSVTLEAPVNSVTVILGPNGAGKTTLLKSVIGVIPSPQASGEKNEIRFDNKVINRWPIYKRVEAGLLYLPQQSSLFQHMTVQENLDLVYENHPYWQKQPINMFRNDSAKLLDQTTLSETRNQYAGTLSGGQKRKLEVVRSLLMQPKMLLLDEPFAGVDPKSIYELKQILTSVATNNVGILISDHHVDQLLSIAHNVYVIIGGQVIASGSIKEVLQNNLTKESYLGAQFYQEMAQRFLE